MAANNKLKNFLTTLYYKRFHITQEEKRLMAIRDSPSDNAAIRNDAAIVAARGKGKLMDELIDEFLDKVIGER